MATGLRAPITISKTTPTSETLSDALSEPAFKGLGFSLNLLDDFDELTATPRQPRLIKNGVAPSAQAFTSSVKP
ncbi:hypothetical protein FRC09_006952 [Ceratobasidium sp. 395]|nr:hypothetical protein FRC09_006952 [Ceratobasidium sp. 395]